MFIYSRGILSLPKKNEIINSQKKKPNKKVITPKANLEEPVFIFSKVPDNPIPDMC